MERNGMTIIDAPTVNSKESAPAGEVLIEFYQALGWNCLDTIDPRKIRTTEDVWQKLLDALSAQLPNTAAASMVLVNWGPGVDTDIAPGKVYLLPGWLNPEAAAGRK